MLTNFVSLHIWNNLLLAWMLSTPVVNCWQILYLCISETIEQIIGNSGIKLWIADKFCIFAYLKQLSCWVFCWCYVVNCWQILYLCTSETINLILYVLGFVLWIADKFCIFARLKQLTNITGILSDSCELLTNFVSLHVWNNAWELSTANGVVVNCWQILYLCTSETMLGNYLLPTV